MTIATKAKLWRISKLLLACKNYSNSISLWGRVENRSKVGRTPWSAAGPLASLPQVFIAFGGPQGHADRLPNLRPIGKIGLPPPTKDLLAPVAVVCGAAALWGCQNLRRIAKIR